MIIFQITNLWKAIVFVYMFQSWYKKINQVIFVNFKPFETLISGIQRYALSFAGAMVVAHALKKAKDRREGLRDAILMDYIRKFPDDFPPPGTYLIYALIFL